MKISWYQWLPALGAALTLSAFALEPAGLRCEYERAPLGVDTTAPRLFWNFTGTGRGERQSAYRILAASTPALLAQGKGDLWDSGRVASSESIQIPYAGQPLATAQTVHWQVKIWDQDGKESRWSEPARWIMGIRREADWQGAQWITAPGALAAPAARKSIGYHAGETTKDETKWVQVDLGRDCALETIRLQPMHHQGQDGFGFPVRFTILAASDPAFQNALVLADHSRADFPNPGAQPVSFPATNVTARYVRVTATKLWPRLPKYCFALRQLEVFAGGRNLAAGAKVTHLDTVENFGWGAAGLTDGAPPETEAPAENYDSFLLRREFQVKPGLRQALVYVCGLGQYELMVNGRKSGADLLAPGWTKFDRTCLYDTHEVTALLQPGRNALGLTLANGMYRVRGGRYTKFKGSFGPNQAIAQLRLVYADGSTEILGTDRQWKTAPGPITFSCVYGGEDYDARRAAPRWSETGFADAAWQAAAPAKGPGGALRGLSTAAPPLQAIEVLTPAKCTPLRPGVEVYDLGQNAPIMILLEASGPAGSAIKVIPAELLRPDGAVDRGSSGGGECYWKYTLAGSAGGERWAPQFFYHGCRYLQVERLPAAPGGARPEVRSLTGRVVHTVSAPAGDFACSSDLFNRIRTLIRWAQRANLTHVITDCPHRERLGWLEQYHLNGPSLRYEFDLARMFAKGMNDMADSQLASGLVPDIAPEYTVFDGGFRDSPEWGSAYVIVPWQQYEWTGDLELLRRHFAGMKRYVDYLGSRARGQIVSHGLGDWYDLGPKPPGYAQLTPLALTATAFYYEDARIVAQAARLLGQEADAQKYAALAADIRAAFRGKFFDAARGKFATGSQCANALPLVMGLAEPSEAPALVAALAEDVRRRGNAVSAGDVGYRYLLRALADGGRSEVLYAMNHQAEKPGYGYQLKQGATSLTEAWDAGRGSSQNHFMLGHIMEWFYHDLAGIGGDPAGPGFRRIIIRPRPVEGLDWARGRYQSVRGEIATEWKKNGGQFRLAVTIPPNTQATVYVPAAAAEQVTESGRPAARAPGVQFLRYENREAVYAVGSGNYLFASE